VAIAEEPDEKAYAAVSMYSILIARAEALMLDESVPNSIKRRIQQADAVLSPQVLNSEVVITEYRAAQTAFEGGSTTQDKLNYAIANIQRWTQELLEMLPALKSAVIEGEQ
jgi:hypothetical protein